MRYATTRRRMATPRSGMPFNVATLASCGTPARARLGEDGHKGLVMMLEGPSARGVPGRLAGIAEIGAVEHAGHRRGQFLGIVRIVDHGARRGRTEQFRCAVEPGCDDR